MNPALRRIGFQFAITAMLLRALLPADWMPDASGQTLFTICSVAGIATASLSVGKKSDRHLPGQDKGRTHEMCAHVCATHFVPPVAKLTVTPPSLIADVAAIQRAMARSFENARYIQQSPRAPPSFA